MTILICGCDRLAADSLAMALRTLGFVVVTACSARDIDPELAVAVALLYSNEIVPRVLANVHACRTRFPSAPIVLIGGNHSERELINFIQSGVRAYTSADTPVEELIRVLKTVTAGEAPCSGRLAALVSSRIATLARAQRQAISFAGLTAREQEVLSLLKAGLSNKEIAQQLSISSNTVKIHVHRVLRKLQIRRRYETRLWSVNGPAPSPAASMRDA
jgi:DNA-binding NarL/FixJ family response regulator